MDPTHGAKASSFELIEMTPDFGQIPVETVEIKPEQRLIVVSDPRSPGADRYRYLRMRLRELRVKGQMKSLVITSPTPQDGKSTVAMNLATILAESGRRQVLLLEADLHRPGLAKTLKIPALPGLAECLESGLDPMEAIRKIEPLHWYLMQAGKPRGNATELLQTASLPALMDTLTSRFDWVIVDTPPVAPLTDALCLSRLVDASLLVLRAGKTQMCIRDRVYGVGYSTGTLVIGLIGAMWGLRIQRVAPTTAAMALGETKNGMYANCVRSLALIAMIAATAVGGGLAWIAASALLFEFFALLINIVLLVRQSPVPLWTHVLPISLLSVWMIIAAGIGAWAEHQPALIAASTTIVTLIVSLTTLIVCFQELRVALAPLVLKQFRRYVPC